jgi:2-phospho-L-lactate transferase/gluconeogenesis factor (CofD/UPF0052 family)
MGNPQNNTPLSTVKVVLFSGGSGSGVLSRELIRNPQVSLTLAINGYDDGASTGEVRRFLGDCLGPSDFRKNASRLARELQSCSRALIDLLDLRLPKEFAEAQAIETLHSIYGEPALDPSRFQGMLEALCQGMEAASRKAVANRLAVFEVEFRKVGGTFVWSDCSIGNLVFAGCFLHAERSFNGAVEEYCTLLHLPAGLIENVTTGGNAWLVAIDSQNRLVGSEAEIVDASTHRKMKDIYLVDHFIDADERRSLSVSSLDHLIVFLGKHTPQVAPNPRLLKRISEADLVIYAPGTQHSSLFPSYMTPGIGAAIAHNLTAIKLLITNIQEDAEISESSAVDIIDKALYYLRGKGRISAPTPCLITHYLINDPDTSDTGTSENDTAHVPLGRLETIEDPRLVRIGTYEEGLTGRHQAGKVLTPFVTSILKRQAHPRIAVFLLNTDSPNKLAQSILEMLRGGIQDLSLHVEVFYHSQGCLDCNFVRLLPFAVTNTCATRNSPQKGAVISIARSQSFDYLVLFDSSGMYRGEDIVNLAALLTNRRLDAIWGSRRLSTRDIHESYKMRYQHNTIVGAISYVGSHVLSLAYLLLYGRHIADSLSSIQAVRSAYLCSGDISLGDPCANHQILSVLLRNRAEIIESPVQFFPITPERVRRTKITDGLTALGVILRWRFKSLEQACVPSS